MEGDSSRTNKDFQIESKKLKPVINVTGLPDGVMEVSFGQGGPKMIIPKGKYRIDRAKIIH